jgi:hypothetical protein
MEIWYNHLGRVTAHILEMMLVKDGLVQRTALCEKCVFCTAQYIQAITLYYIHSDCKITLKMAVVMKATKLNQLFEREGGVSQVIKKN